MYLLKDLLKEKGRHLWVGKGLLQLTVKNLSENKMAHSWDLHNLYDY